MSLRTRDPDVARRTAWRLHAEFEKLTENRRADMDSLDVTGLLNDVVVHDLGAHLDRLDRDLTQQVPVRFLTRDDLLHARFREMRIVGRLYRLAGERGFTLEFDDKLNGELIRDHFTAFERQEIKQRIERGFLRNLIVPDETGADMPPYSDVCKAAEEAGDVSPKTLLRIYTAIVLEKADTLEKFTGNYDAARRQPERAAIVVRRALDNPDIRSRPDWADPTFTTADAVEREQLIFMNNCPVEILRAAKRVRNNHLDGAGQTKRDSAVTASGPSATIVTAPAHSLVGPTSSHPPAQFDTQTQPGTRSEDIGGSGRAFSPWQSRQGSSVTPMRVLIAPARDPRRSFHTLIERLLASRTDWAVETMRQHRSLGRLLALTVGSDDLQDFRQSHIGEYITNLSLLPKSYGKSEKDEFKTLAEILERSSSLDPGKVGLIAPTVNRHLTQLGTILKHARLWGSDIGDPATLTASRRRDRRPDNSKRGVFSDGEIRTLVRDELWTQSTSSAALAGLRDTWAGELPSLYWMPLLALYSFARLSELCYLRTSDVEIGERMIVLVDYDQRSLKTETSRRRLPLHAELLRLGFLNYVAKRAREGSHLLFPDLRDRGEKSKLGTLFDTLFPHVLDRALPQARDQKKTFHSIRHFGNGILIKKRVLDPVREALFGHSGKTVNTRVYGHVDDDVLRATIAEFPSFTCHITPIYKD